MSTPSSIDKFPSTPEDRAAALDLAKENPLLMSDPDTRYVIEHEGKTPDGREVEGGVEDFLQNRLAWLKNNPPYLSGKPRRVGDIPPQTRRDNPDIWEKGTDKK